MVYHRIGLENEASETRRTTDAAARFREWSQPMRRVSIGHLEANETGGEREGTDQQKAEIVNLATASHPRQVEEEKVRDS